VSLLIAHGADVVHVSRQLGHAKPDIALRIYAHLFDAVAQADPTRTRLTRRSAASPPRILTAGQDR
jgi:integrase